MGIKRVKKIGDKPKILVVNEDKHFRRQIIWALEEDFELFEAGDRKTALRYLEEGKKPDIVLMDLYLPLRPDFIEEGILLLNRAKEIAPEVKVVILTTDSKTETIANTKELGTDDYIVMPFNIEDLRRALKEVISKPVPIARNQKRRL